MGYADADIKHTTPAGVRDEEGFRASFIRKRHSLFGRPESVPSFDLNAPQIVAAKAVPTVQGVLYHNLDSGRPPPSSSSERKATEPVESRRRSFFGARFKFGGKKEEQITQPVAQVIVQQSQPPPKLDLPTLARPLRTELSEDRPNFLSEEEYYRNHTKQSISPPFNFQHVTHTQKDHLPALSEVDEKDLSQEFWASSAQQVPHRQLQGIQAQNLRREPAIVEQYRERQQLRPSSPPRSRPTSMSQIMPQPHGRSSREDITALPGLAKVKRSGSKSRRDDLDALLGRGEKSSSGTEQASNKARTDTYNALLGIKEESERGSSQGTGEDIGSLLGFSALAAKRSAESSKTNPTREQSKRLSGAGTKSRNNVTSLLGLRDRTTSESSDKPAKKRDDVNALLGITEESTSVSKRHSKQPVDKGKKEEIDALLGMPRKKEKKEFEPMAPPAPPRPRRSDEEIRPLPAKTTAAPPPDRPRRDSKDVQYLREMGFGQLLYRESSNESRTSQPLQREISNESRHPQHILRQSNVDSRYAQPMYRQGSNDSRYAQPMLRQNSNESRHSPVSPLTPQYSPVVSEAPIYPGVGASFGAMTEDVNRSQQLNYRLRQPLPAIPRPSNLTPEGRSPRALHTVNEGSEQHSPLRSPIDPAMSPRSPNSMHSAGRTVRNPELTGPSIPDDGAWEREIDFLYSREAEATNEFDWENVSMTPQRLSMRDPDKRLSLNIPSEAGSARNTMRLSKKLSEGSLRSSIYMPSALNVQPYQPHLQHGYAKQMVPANDYATAGARASPEVRVEDVDYQRHDTYPVSTLQMHGYESIAQGYLSDPESNSEQSQHRKSNSYSSWESRPSNNPRDYAPGVQREYARYSNVSINNVPELTYTRRPKQPITSIQGYQSPQEAPVNPMNEYAAFSRGPYASPYDSPQTPDYPPRRFENLNQAAVLRATAARQPQPQPQPDTYTQQMRSSNQSSGWI